MDRSFVGNVIPVRRVRFYRPPSEAFVIPYSFVTNKFAVTSSGVAAQSLSDDSDEPIVPFAYRHCIVLHALYNWYRDKKDDDRATTAKREYEQLMERIASATEVGGIRPRIEPRMGPYRRAASLPYRSGNNGRYTTGDRFDQLRRY